MKAILEEAKKFLDPKNVEVFRESWNEDSVGYEMNRLKSINSRQVDGYGLRIIKNGRIGFTGGTCYDPADMVQRAITASEFGPEATYEFANPSKPANPQIFDPAIEKLDVTKMVQKGREILNYMLEKRSDAQFSISLEKYLETKGILSGKIDLSYRKSIYSISISAHLFREGDFLNIYDSQSRSLMEKNERDMAGRILELLSLADREATINTSVIPAVFSPRGLREILRFILINLNGRTVEKGASPLVGKMDQKILPEQVSIFDDGAIDGTAVAEPFDDEGVGIRRYSLVENGILRNLILDLRCASVLGMSPTGSAERSYSSHPRPAAHGIILEPGEVDDNTLLRDIKEGIYIDQLIGAHTGNPFSGDFQLNVDLGFKIKNGKKVGRVKNVMIAGNIYTLFDSLSAFSNKSEWVGTYFLPHARFEKLSVAGK